MKYVHKAPKSFDDLIFVRYTHNDIEYCTLNPYLDGGKLIYLEHVRTDLATNSRRMLEEIAIRLGIKQTCIMSHDQLLAAIRANPFKLPKKN
jgi:hypothetical protein